jgi:hypothetical protein
VCPVYAKGSKVGWQPTRIPVTAQFGKPVNRMIKEIFCAHFAKWRIFKMPTLWLRYISQH